MSEFKTGRLSKKECAQILEWHNILSPADMATRLGRRLEAIEEYIDKHVPKVQQDKTDIDLLNRLHGRVYWQDIEKQFTEREVRKFEVYWVELVKQFNEDIEFSEEMQVVDLVKTNLLMDRNLEDRAKAKKEIEAIQAKLDEFILKNGHPPYEGEDYVLRERNHAILYQSVKACEASYVSRTAELDTLMKKKESYFEELKATRKQRIEFLKNVKKDFVNLIKSLMDEKTRSREGIETDLMNKAAEKELNRLSEYHIFADGFGDKPILNHETVGEDGREQTEDRDTEAMQVSESD